MFFGGTEAPDVERIAAKSLRFNDPDTAYLKWQPVSAGNRKTWTLSFWLKTCLVIPGHIFGAWLDTNNRDNTYLLTNSSRIQFTLNWKTAGSWHVDKSSNDQFRDASAWQHIVIRWNTPDGTASERAKVWSNGELLTWGGGYSVTDPGQNDDSIWNAACPHYIGAGPENDGSLQSTYLNGYLSDLYFIDGEALEPSDFTMTNGTTGQLVPKEYTGDYGQNGFYLRFFDSSTVSRVGLDYSSNGLLSSATGALPFYNTNNDSEGTDFGLVKGSGYRTDSSAGTTSGTGLVLAIPGDVLTDEHDHVNTGSSAKNVVNNGTTATSTAEARFYGTAMSFNGAGKYLEIKDGSGNPYADFAFGTGDFTVEAWVYANNWDESYNAIFNNFRDDDSTTGWSMLITSGAKMHINHMGDYNNGTTTIPTKRWVHLAMVKDGSANTTTRYIDGFQDATTLSSSQSITNTNQGLCIGGAGSEYNNRDFDGYIQDARIYKGVKKYTAAFTPPRRNSWEPNNIHVVAGPVYSESSRFTPHTNASEYLTNVNANMFDSSENTYVSYTNGNQPNSGFTWSASGLSLSGALTVKTYGDGGNPSTITVVHGSGTATVSHTSGTGWAELGKLTGIVSIDVNRHDQGICHGIKIGGVLITDGMDGGGTIDVLRDSPSNGTASDETGAGGIVPGNYPTFNPLWTGPNYAFTNGNLEASNGGGWYTYLATQAIPKTGKYYWECRRPTNTWLAVGITDGKAANTSYGSQYACQYVSNHGNLDKKSAGSHTTVSSWGDTWQSTSDVIGVAYDADNEKIWFAKNNTWQDTSGTPNPATGADPAMSGFGGTEMFPHCNIYISSAEWNFGQRPFKYTMPSGFKPLATPFHPDPAIADPTNHFQPIGYTGDGSATRTVTGWKFDPDLLWIKERPTDGWQHTLYDKIRGAGTNSVKKSLNTDSNNSEASGNDTTHGYLSSFESGGYGLTKGSQGGGDYMNHSGWTYIAWGWKAATTASGTWGANSKAYSRRIDSTAGISIIKYTGDASTGIPGTGAIPHGLSGAPDLIIQKRIDATGNWWAGFNILDASWDYMKVDDDTAKGDEGYALWDADEISNWGAPDNSEFMTYVFKSIPGFSRFGKYSGNNSNDGQLIQCGFAPAYVMIKRTDSTGNWAINDTVRDGNNMDYGNDASIYANTADSEKTSSSLNLDFLSNGFKLRSNNASYNGTGTYIYLAFASKPFKYARAVN